VSLAILGPWWTLEELRAERTRREAERLKTDFAAFVKAAWPVIDPAPLVWSWHLDAICLHLQAVTEGRISQLLINIPPGHAKSLLVSVLWPAWVWARKPEWQSIFSSYELGLVTRDAVRSRDLINSEWYIQRFRKDWEFRDDQNLKKFFSNTKGGFRVGVSVGSGTGYRGDALVVDDPLSADQANSKLERESANRWFFETMSSRFNDMENGTRVVIMQRLHESDLSGEILRRKGYQHLCLPSEFNPKSRSITYTKDGSELWRDPRSTQGELLFPAKFTTSVLAKSKKDLGSYAFSGQHDQNPVPPKGGLIQRAWFNRRWLAPGERARPEFETQPLITEESFDLWALVTDAAFKKTEDSDLVACGVFARRGPNLFMVDLIWERLTFTETLSAIQLLLRRWPQVSEIAIEDKANGSAVIEVLKKTVFGVVPIEPEGGKEARIAAASPAIEAGNLWLPQTDLWRRMDGEPITVESYIGEASAFPKAAHDDAIDMTAYAITRYLTRNDLAVLAALATR
jgi:predicted phage terminase large subunit-like protein